MTNTDWLKGGTNGLAGVLLMKAIQSGSSLLKRSDYTYKFNAKTGRHGWLRLTPAYSVKIVEELILDLPPGQRILDPFCGTGTTALSAAYYGHKSVTIDINPFLIWLSRAKIAYYSATQIAATREAGASVIDWVQSRSVEPAAAPAIHRIERWWNPEALEILCFMRAAISAITTEGSAEQTLLLVAFCRSLITMSNAAFNHQSMSFKRPHLGIELDWDRVFSDAITFVLAGAENNPKSEGSVVYGDARDPGAVVDSSFDLVITSPPYANRMSYIRELRPYMYWLGFLNDSSSAGELDWTAIGGTWGIATSRLLEWQRSSNSFNSRRLSQALDQITRSDNKYGRILAQYVSKYFDDMWLHFQGMAKVLDRGAELHYIVGNSTFYGTLISTELLYTEMLAALGFRKIETRPVRKRNSKRELIEFDVVASSP